MNVNFSKMLFILIIFIIVNFFFYKCSQNGQKIGSQFILNSSSITLDDKKYTIDTFMNYDNTIKYKFKSKKIKHKRKNKHKK